MSLGLYIYILETINLLHSRTMDIKLARIEINTNNKNLMFSKETCTEMGIKKFIHFLSFEFHIFYILTTISFTYCTYSK